MPVHDSRYGLRLYGSWAWDYNVPLNTVIYLDLLAGRWQDVRLLTLAVTGYQGASTGFPRLLDPDNKPALETLGGGTNQGYISVYTNTDRREIWLPQGIRARPRLVFSTATVSNLPGQLVAWGLPLPHCCDDDV